MLPYDTVKTKKVVVKYIIFRNLPINMVEEENLKK